MVDRGARTNRCGCCDRRWESMMQVRTGQPEATRSENQGEPRRDVIEGLRGLEAASADLRTSLLQLEERVQRARHHLEGGGPVADLPRVAHVMEQRARVNACLA